MVLKITNSKLYNKNFILLLISAGLINIQNQLINPTMLKFSAENGINSTTASYIVGFFAVGSLVIRPFSGLISDKIFCKHIAVLSALLMAISCLLYGFLYESIFMMIAIRFVHGASFALSGTALMHWVSSFIPQDKVGKGMGIFGAGQILSLVIGPFIAIFFAQSSTYMWLFVSASLLSIISGVLIIFAQNEKKFKTEKGLFSKKVFGVSIFAFILFFVNGIEIAYIIVFGESIGVQNTWLYFLITAISMAISRFCLSSFLDKFEINRLIMISFFLISFSFVMLIFSSNISIIFYYIAGGIKGLAHAVAQPALQSQSIKLVSVKERGKASATFYTACDLGMSLGPILTAPINQRYGLIFLIAGGIVLIFAFFGNFSFKNLSNKVG